MATTIVYAVGGTGAKLLEALVHLCAAGLTSERLLLRIVDQDDTNGNVARTRELIGDYVKVRSWLRRGADEPGAIIRSPLHGADRVMRVIPNVDATLASAFGLGELDNIGLGDDDLLMQALFSRDERAGRMVNGFRGQPAVGAAVFLSPESRRESELWTTIDADLALAATGQVDQFLLLGSSFGGTGAAGVPTLASYLRASLVRAKNPPRIGAVLMLRYYGVTANSLYGPAAPAQIKTAMEFYGQVLRAPTGSGRERLFDSLYLVGLGSEMVIPAEREGGGAGQVNPALMPELIGALGAVHFIERRGLQQGAGQNWRDPDPGKPVWLCGHRTADRVSWPDLPATRPAGVGVGEASDAEQDRRLICSFARFAFCYAYGVHAAEALSRVPNAADLPMYFRLLDPQRLRQGQYDQDARLLSVLVQKFLRWLGAMHAVTRGDGGLAAGDATSIELGDFASLVVEQQEFADRFRLRHDPATLGVRTSKELIELQNVFDTIRLAEEAPSLSRVISRLATIPRPRGRERRLSGFVDAVYQAALLPA